MENRTTRSEGTTPTDTLQRFVRLLLAWMSGTVDATDAHIPILVTLVKETAMTLEQHDAHECMLRILGILGESFETLFRFDFRSTVCCECDAPPTSVAYHNTMLSLPCDYATQFLRDSTQPVPLEMAIVRASEILTDYTCDHCHEKKIQRSTTRVVSLPHIIQILIQHSSRSVVNTQEIQEYWPNQLNFTQDSKHMEYTLVAQIERVGAIESGHYYAIVRRQLGWYICNDAIVQPTQAPNVTPTTYARYYVVTRQL